MPSKRGKFSPEFREAAVREVVEKSRPIVDVARENGLVAQTLGNWVNAWRTAHVGAEPALSLMELGYAGPDPSARSLRGSETGALGVVLCEHLTHAFEDPQDAAFLAGSTRGAESGDGMMILPVTSSSQDLGRVGTAAVDYFVVRTTSNDFPIVRAALATRRRAAAASGEPRARLVGPGAAAFAAAG